METEIAEIKKKQVGSTLKSGSVGDGKQDIFKVANNIGYDYLLNASPVLTKHVYVLGFIN